LLSYFYLIFQNEEYSILSIRIFLKYIKKDMTGKPKTDLE